MRTSRRQLVAVLALALAQVGCASDGSARAERDALRAEVRALRRENEDLSRKVDALGGQVEALAARSRAAREPAAAAPASAPAAAAPAIPEGLAVVKVVPPAPSPFDRLRAGGSSRASPRRPSAGSGRAGVPPPVPTAIPIQEPDADRLEQLSRGGRPLAAAAEAELKAARAQAGTDRAHALEDFAARYPRHPSADNALAEASAAYAAAGSDDAACGLARKLSDGYPAGDAMPDALERLAACEARRGATDLERQLLARLVSEHPRSPAAQRAGARLKALAGEGAVAPAPAPASTRSDP